jgi:hypothetical protein
VDRARTLGVPPAKYYILRKGFAVERDKADSKDWKLAPQTKDMLLKNFPT